MWTRSGYFTQTDGTGGTIFVIFYFRLVVDVRVAVNVEEKAIVKLRFSLHSAVMAGEMWVCLPGLSFCWDLISLGSRAKKTKNK